MILLVCLFLIHSLIRPARVLWHDECVNNTSSISLNNKDIISMMHFLKQIEIKVMKTSYKHTNSNMRNLN